MVYNVSILYNFIPLKRFGTEIKANKEFKIGTYSEWLLKNYSREF